jgi:hypothetical protein
MALPGLVAAKNLADVADRERAWDNLGLNISANFDIDPLLFLYPGAAAVYSLRPLGLPFLNSPVIRIRRSSDNAEADFTATQINDGSLIAFVGAGNNGFVRTWYDQSGNGRNLQNSTLSRQFQMVTGGVLDTQGGKACIKSTDRTRSMFANVSYSSTSHSVFKVATITGTTLPLRMLTIANEQAVLRKNNTQFQMFGTGVRNIETGFFPVTRVLLSGIWLHAIGDIFAFSNGASVLTDTIGAGGTASVAGYQIGSSSEALIGNMQEVIIYPSNQTANRAAIESSINDYYAIF